MSLPATGKLELQITGTLQDMVSKLSQFVAALQAQGIDPTPLKNSQVIITLGQDPITQAAFLLVQNAIAVWRGQVLGTSVIVNARLILQD